VAAKTGGHKKNAGLVTRKKSFDRINKINRMKSVFFAFPASGPEA
jgi:hypothetical protein